MGVYVYSRNVLSDGYRQRSPVLPGKAIGPRGPIRPTIGWPPGCAGIVTIPVASCIPSNRARSARLARRSVQSIRSRIAVNINIGGSHGFRSLVISNPSLKKSDNRRPGYMPLMPAQLIWLLVIFIWIFPPCSMVI
jgi:hypothetical protein